jgi:hypothetical protein
MLLEKHFLIRALGDPFIDFYRPLSDVLVFLCGEFVGSVGLGVKVGAVLLEAGCVGGCGHDGVWYDILGRCGLVLCG